MNQVSDRILNMASSATIAMSQKSSELRAKGIDIINLSVGEPDFHTPDHIKLAAKQAIDDNFTYYPPVPGYLSLRQAVCAKLLKENGLSYSPDQIVCSNGAKQSVCNAVLALLNSGDEAIIPAPYWVSYTEMVKLAEGVPVVVPTDIESGFKLTAAQLRAAITPRTRLLILCSPCNPTGALYSAEELRRLVEVLADYPQIFVISDEIYEHISYSDAPVSIASFDGMLERTAVVNGVSKSYAMTGWRLGWLAAPLWLAKACSKLQGQYTSASSSIAQKAAEAAYLGSQQCVVDMREEFRNRRDLIVELVRQVPGFELAVPPQGAFYVFPQCDSLYGKTFDGVKITDSSSLAMYLLEHAHVAAVAGSAFGDDRFLRFSYATSEQNIIEAFKRIRQALAKS